MRIALGMSSPLACPQWHTSCRCPWADELDQIRKRGGSRSQLASFISPLFSKFLDATLLGRAVSLPSPELAGVCPLLPAPSRSRPDPSTFNDALVSARLYRARQSAKFSTPMIRFQFEKFRCRSLNGEVSGNNRASPSLLVPRFSALAPGRLLVVRKLDIASCWAEA